MNNYFPSISRIITEALKFSLLVLTFFVFAIFLKNINDYRLQQKEKGDLVKKAEFWKNVTVDKLDYRDAFFEVALYEYRLKDYDSSKLYLQKALTLDPNFKEGKMLENVLSNY